MVTKSWMTVRLRLLPNNLQTDQNYVKSFYSFQLHFLTPRNFRFSCQQQQKNEANAKLNLSQNSVEPSITTFPVVPVHSAAQTESSEAPTNLIDLQKTTPCNNNCNIFQHEETAEDLDPACALLSAHPAPNHKLTYKKPLVITWTDSDVKPSNSQ